MRVKERVLFAFEQQGVPAWWMFRAHSAMALQTRTSEEMQQGIGHSPFIAFLKWSATQQGAGFFLLVGLGCMLQALLTCAEHAVSSCTGAVVECS